MDGTDHPPTSRPPWAWRLTVRLVRWLLRGLFGWRVHARRPDVIPQPGTPLVVVINHTSNVDAFLVADTLWRRMRRWCQPLAKAELFDLPVLGIIVRQGGAIPVTRDEGVGREAAYDAAVARLREGATVLVAPEGTTTHDGSLLPLRHGAARLALEAGVDVLVITHFGAQRGFSPVVRVPERGAVVTMTCDVLSPWPDEDASSLTGRIAATMMDRSAELQASYPQADPEAPWWPPYAVPASPTAAARENLERYRQSMTEAIAHARERMARFAEEYEVEQRVAQARERGLEIAEDLAARSRERAETIAEHARHRVEDLATQARERAASIGERLSADEDAGEDDHDERDGDEDDVAGDSGPDRPPPRAADEP